MIPEDSQRDKIELFTPREVGVRRAAMLPRPRPSVTMEKPPDLVAWWRIVRKLRWTVLSALLLVFVMVLTGSIFEKPVYRAKALIEIDKENPSVADPQEMFLVDEVSDAYLETQYKVLASDDLAERVIQQLHLEKQSEFAPTVRLWPWQPRAVPASPPPTDSAAAPDLAVRGIVLTRFQDRLDIRPIRRSRAVELRFDSRNPQIDRIGCRP